MNIKKIKHFLKGMSCITLFPSPIELDDRDPNIIDAEAIASDFQTVFNDIETAYRFLLKDDFSMLLELADENDAEYFTFLLNSGIQLFNISDEEIRHRFDISMPTLQRWKNGTNAPHPAMRRPVYAWLRTLVKEHLE